MRSSPPTSPEHRKVRNVRRDPRVALSIETPNRNRIGLQEYLVIHGHARITEGDAPELLQTLAHTYLGPDVKFPPMDNPPPGYITHITVDRIGGGRAVAGTSVYACRKAQSYGTSGENGSRRSTAAGSCGSVAQFATSAALSPMPLKPFHTIAGTVTRA